MLAVLAVSLFVASVSAGNKLHLPGVALHWWLLLEIIRAALALAIVAAVVMVVVRGIGGIWPSGVSAQGFDYSAALSKAAELRAQDLELDQLEAEARATRGGIAR